MEDRIKQQIKRKHAIYIHVCYYYYYYDIEFILICSI